MENSKTVNVKKTNYKLTSLSKYSSERLLNYFETGHKCDVVFITKEDDRKIAAHMLTLECASEYFATMFNTELNKSNDSNEYVINNIDGPIFRTIVQSLYTNNVTVTDDNCMKLFEAAHLMLLTEIEDVCNKFMCKNISMENCLEFLAFAQVYTIEDLSDIAVEFIFNNFTKVTKSEEFLKLPVNIVESLLNGASIFCPSEEEMFEAFKDWIEYDLDNRKCYIKQLISLIKLPLIKTEYFWETIDKWIQDHMEDLLISRNVGKWHATQKIDSDFKHMTISRKFGNNIIFSKFTPGYQRQFNLNCFDKYFNEHSLSGLNNAGVNPVNPFLTYHGNNIFLYDAYNESVVEFSLITSQFKQCFGPSTHSGYQYHSVICHHQNIYIFKQSGTSLSSKKYNIKEKKMITLNTFNNACNIIHGATLNDNIYLVESKTPNALKQYGINQQTLTDITTMQKISGHCKLAVVNDILYAIGGDKTVECFNCNDKCFMVLHNGIVEETFNFESVCVINTKIICFASYQPAKNYCKLMEFDTVNKTWNDLKDIQYDPNYGKLCYALLSINQ